MYPYATTNLQQEQLTQLETLNTNIETLNNNVLTIATFTSIIICILIIKMVKKLVIKCLGGKD